MQRVFGVASDVCSRTGVGVTGLERRTRMRRVSKRRLAVNRQRRKMANEHFPKHPMCAVPGCRRPADDLHEVLSRARGGSIVDPANCKPLCRPHHNEITDTEPAWAYELGLLRHSWDQPIQRSAS